MKVVDSSVAFSTAYLFHEYRETELSVTAWRDGRPVGEGTGRGHRAVTARAVHDDLVKVSQEAREALENQPVEPDEPEMKCEGDVKVQIIRMLIEKMTGKRLKMVSLENPACGRKSGEAFEKTQETEPAPLFP
jgi:hypothetical protein